MKMAEYMEQHIGENYVGSESSKKSKGVVQDAHEAIRPTSVLRKPEDMDQYLAS